MEYGYVGTSRDMAEAHGESRDRWKRAVDRQYSFFGTTLGLIIAALAIVASPVAEGKLRPTQVDKILFTIAALGAFLSVLVLQRMVHLERKIAFFGGTERERNLENRHRKTVNITLAITVFTVLLLMLIKVWGL